MKHTATVLLSVQNAVPAGILNPPPGATLTQSTTTFSWSAGSGVSQYALWAGSSPRGQNYFAASIAASSRRITVVLPQGTEPYYVTLASLLPSGWVYQDYLYQINPGASTPPLTLSGPAQAPLVSNTRTTEQVTDPYGHPYTYTFSSGDATQIQSVTASDNGIVPRVIGLTQTSITFGFTVGYVKHGPRTLTLKVGESSTVLLPMEVADGDPWAFVDDITFGDTETEQNVGIHGYGFCAPGGVTSFAFTGCDLAFAGAGSDLCSGAGEASIPVMVPARTQGTCQLTIFAVNQWGDGGVEGYPGSAGETTVPFQVNYLRSGTYGPVIDYIEQPQPLYGGYEGLLKIHGAHFGSAPGSISICPAGVSPCQAPDPSEFPCDLGPSGSECTHISFDAWDDGLIQVRLTLVKGYEYYSNWQLVVSTSTTSSTAFSSDIRPRESVGLLPAAVASSAPADFLVSPDPYECGHPVKLVQIAAGRDIGGGALYTEYRYESSSHNLNDLRSCKVGERVTYPGNVNPFVLPVPFPNLAINNPTVTNFDPGDGLNDTQSTPGDFRQPYSLSEFSASQIYRYHCGCYDGDAWHTLTAKFSTDGNSQVDSPLSIYRGVKQDSNSKWYFSACKTAWRPITQDVCANIAPLPGQ